MKLEDVGRDLQERAERLRAAGTSPDIEELLHAAREVAAGIKAAASRNGHQVGVRVVQRSTGVRITITGPQATRYRAMAQQGMDRRMPGVEAVIRAQITRRAK